jgi:hypothetical protein
MILADGFVVWRRDDAITGVESSFGNIVLSTWGLAEFRLVIIPK